MNNIGKGNEEKDNNSTKNEIISNANEEYNNENLSSKNIENKICENSDESHTDSNESEFEENEFSSSSEFEMNDEKEIQIEDNNKKKKTICIKRINKNTNKEVNIEETKYYLPKKIMNY